MGSLYHRSWQKQTYQVKEEQFLTKTMKKKKKKREKEKKEKSLKKDISVFQV